MITLFDERLLSQAFSNLVKNAAEAIPGTDDETEALEGAERGKVHIHGQLLDDKYVIDIIDNGKGWPKENRHQLLEPYMTTRKKGTGLGLAIVVKVIEEHNGQMRLLDAPDYDETGRGAMVRITLPTANDPSLDEPTQEDQSEEGLTSQSETQTASI